MIAAPLLRYKWNLNYQSDLLDHLRQHSWYERLTTRRWTSPWFCVAKVWGVKMQTLLQRKWAEMSHPVERKQKFGYRKVTWKKLFKENMFLCTTYFGTAYNWIEYLALPIDIINDTESISRLKIGQFYLPIQKQLNMKKHQAISFRKKSYGLVAMQGYDRQCNLIKLMHKIDWKTLLCLNCIGTLEVPIVIFYTMHFMTMSFALFE